MQPPPARPASGAALPVVLVLASGRGERFRASGGRTHKLQALLHGKTVLQHTLDAVRASGLDWHLEDAGHPTLGDSIAAAVQATRSAPGGWMVLPADLPLIQAHTLQHIAHTAPDTPVLRPSYQGQPGHPVRFAPVCGPALCAVQGHSGAMHVVQAFARSRVAVDDVGCVFDIDTVHDLERASAWLHSRACNP